jgi:hypothetical protein
VEYQVERSLIRLDVVPDSAACSGVAFEFFELNSFQDSHKRFALKGWVSCEMERRSLA